MYENVINDILQLEAQKPDDYWREKAEAPLFTKKPFYEYQGEIPEEDIITMSVDTRDAQSRTPLNALVCASTGVGKGRLIKNIVKAYHKQGYKILYFEPKSIEMMNARKMGKGNKVHPLDKNEKLPVVSYVPNYIKSYLDLNYPEMSRKVTFYSPELSKLNYREIWQSFGVPDKAADLIVEMVQKGTTNIDAFIAKIARTSLHSMTKQAALASLNNLKGTGLFSAKRKLDLEVEWEKSNIVVINYFSRDGAFMNTEIGLVLDLIRDIGIMESKKGLKNITKKLIIFDDAFYYAGLSATLATRSSGGINLAIRNISNCQNNFRTWGIDTMFVVQSPDTNAIFPALIDGCTTKFISYVENPSSLQGKVPYAAYSLVSNVNPAKGPVLHVNEQNYLFQWIYVQGKTRWKTGFPFDCTVGHS